MKTTTASITVAFTLAVAFVVPGARWVDCHGQSGVVNSDRRVAGVGHSLTQQERVVRMLDAGPSGIESTVETLRNSSDERLKEAAAYAIGESGNIALTQVLAEASLTPRNNFAARPLRRFRSS